MLETVQLTKIYKPKKGVPVTALDKVSLRFPDKGMVFLLGKSGSGKSTLLNVLGGLDRYDGGEIIIKGKSSKAFKQKHFDSYRNTYIGFIFQEYNILDQFSVGQNIALALQLQGQKATDEQINLILEQVDLAGFGARKPNELSGGQKQRVAIARALVKNPQIIMADEPTGALDSVTGKQVLETLKKLSAEKLVIVVSHDREFAEHYADRIIELADGKVISDMEYRGDAAEQGGAALQFSGNTVSFAPQYRLTEQDREQINRYLDALQAGTADQFVLAAQGTAGAVRKGSPTDQSRVLQQTGGFKLIRSRLPMRFAFRMGASNLKLKKFRLVLTILLSCIAFGLFGLADTFGAFDYVTAATDSFIDSGITYASLSQQIKQQEGDYSYFYESLLSHQQLTALANKTGVPLTGVYSPASHGGGELSLYPYLGEAEDTYNGELYSEGAVGWAEVDQAMLDAMQAQLVCGRLPDGAKKEMLLPLYLVQPFMHRGYLDYDALRDTDRYWQTEPEKIRGAEDMLGKTLLGYTVVGVADTGVDLQRYEDAFIHDPSDSTADMLLKYALRQEFESLRNHSLARLLMVGQGRIDGMIAETVPTFVTKNGIWDVRLIGGGKESDNFIEQHFSRLGEADLLPAGKVQMLQQSGEKGVILPLQRALDMAYSLADDAFWQRFPYSEPSEQELLDLLKGQFFALHYSQQATSGADGGWQVDEVSHNGFYVAGVYAGDNDRDTEVIYMSREWIERLCEQPDGLYTFAIGAMPSDEAGIRQLVRLCDQPDGGVRYELNNAVSYELNTVRDIVETMAPIFLYVGIGFAVFAALMLSNFITMSISNKKREIGILRAIGSRGNDVFRIFFSESFLIAMINFVLTTVGLFALVALLNSLLRSETGLLITILHCGVRQVVLEFGVAMLVAAVASFIPVKRIASKRPIDAIRDR